MTMNAKAIVLYGASTLSLSLLLFALRSVIEYLDRARQGVQRTEFLAITLIAAFTCLWYSLSISFVVFNKWFLVHWEGGFHFSLIYTGCHMVFKWVFSRMWYCGSRTTIHPLEWRDYLFTVVPIGVTTALDIVFSNMSIKYISVTLYTIIKTSVIVWTFVWALLFRIEKFKLKTFISVCFITLGISLAVSSPTAVSWVGVSLCMAAAACGGLRWAMTERLVGMNEQCKDPFVTIFHFSPISALLVTPFALFVELGDFVASPFASNSSLFWEGFVFITVGGAIAFVMLFVEVKIVNLTSSLTIGVLGQLKELTQITLAVVVFGDKLSFINTCGVVASFVFVAVYKWIRRSEMKETLTAESISQKEKQQVNLELQGLLSTGSDSFDLETTDDMYFVVDKTSPSLTSSGSGGGAGAGSGAGGSIALGAGSSKKRLTASLP